jgi:hypothetical protein
MVFATKQVVDQTFGPNFDLSNLLKYFSWNHLGFKEEGKSKMEERFLLFPY